MAIEAGGKWALAAGEVGSEVTVAGASDAAAAEAVGAGGLGVCGAGEGAKERGGDEWEGMSGILW